MPGPALYVNGVDLQTYGVTVHRVGGLRAGPRVTDERLVVPGLAGSVLAGVAPRMDETTLTIEGWCRGATTAELLDRERKLSALFYSGGRLELVAVHDVARVARARTSRFGFVRHDPMLSRSAARFEVEFTLSDPFWYDVDPVVLELRGVQSAGWPDFGGAAGHPKRVPLGGAPSAPIFRVIGATDATWHIVYRNVAGTERGRLTFGVALATGELLEVNCQTHEITKFVGGSGSNAYSTKTGGDFFVFDPADGDPLSDEWPYVHTESATSAFPSGHVRYRRAYPV